MQYIALGRAFLNPRTTSSPAGTSSLWPAVKSKQMDFQDLQGDLPRAHIALREGSGHVLRSPLFQKQAL